MTSTSSDFSDYVSRSTRAIGHVRDGERWVARDIRQPDAQSPAGGVSSSVIDMARWMRMVLALGSFDGKTVVDPSVMSYYQTEADPHPAANGHTWLRGKVLGGSSSVNGMIDLRGHSDDYDAWERDWGCHGWNFRTLVPYFRKAEGSQRFVNEFHGADGPLGVSMPIAPLPVADAFIKAAQQYGIPYNPDFNGAKQEGAGFYQLTQRDGRRSSAASAFLKPAMGRKNLEVRMGVQVSRVVVEKGRAIGVEILSGNNREILRAEREVIVTSGAIGSPKLLLPQRDAGSIGDAVSAEQARLGGGALGEEARLADTAALDRLTKARSYLWRVTFNRGGETFNTAFGG
jgi:choline dehydrogenase-like flavoprotein